MAHGRIDTTKPAWEEEALIRAIARLEEQERQDTCAVHQSPPGITEQFDFNNFTVANLQSIDVVTDKQSDTNCTVQTEQTLV